MSRNRGRRNYRTTPITTMIARLHRGISMKKSWIANGRKVRERSKKEISEKSLKYLDFLLDNVCDRIKKMTNNTSRTENREIIEKTTVF